MEPPNANSGDGFAARVALLRRERQLTQPQLAELAGVSLRQIQRWEAGEDVPHPRNLRGLAAALGVEPHELAEQGLATRQDQLDRIEAKLDRLIESLAPKLDRSTDAARLADDQIE
jgi:transcriptional regulator with XRE-family HTH domain